MQPTCPSFKSPATQLLPLLRTTLRAADAALLGNHRAQHAPTQSCWHRLAPYGLPLAADAAIAPHKHNQSLINNQ
jgi:hypothetical protein